VTGTAQVYAGGLYVTTIVGAPTGRGNATVVPAGVSAQMDVGDVLPPFGPNITLNGTLQDLRLSGIITDMRLRGEMHDLRLVGDVYDLQLRGTAVRDRLIGSITRN
jgi:hypothetical protein